MTNKQFHEYTNVETLPDFLSEIPSLFCSKNDPILNELQKFIDDEEIEELRLELEEILSENINDLSEEKIKELLYEYAGVPYFSEERINKITSPKIKSLFTSENYRSIVKQIEEVTPKIKKEIKRVHQLKQNINNSSQLLEYTTELINRIGTRINLDNIKQLTSTKVIYFKDWMREKIAPIIFEVNADISDVLFEIRANISNINTNVLMPERDGSSQNQNLSEIEELENDTYLLAQKIVEIKTLHDK